MKIAVIGSGYVGLVAGACLAENGNEVICVDKDASKVRALQRGRIPIYEPGLEEMVRRNRAEKRLTFTTDLPKGIRASQIVFIAVGTPTGEDGSADLSHVLEVARQIGKAMNGYKVIVDKSTVPVGTSEKVREAVKGLGIEHASAEVAMVPQNYVKLTGKEAQQMLRLMEAIEEHDDVQHVWSNFDISEKEIEASLA